MNSNTQKERAGRMPRAWQIGRNLEWTAVLLTTSALCSFGAVAAPGDADDDGIPDSIEVDLDRNGDAVPDYSYTTAPFFSEDFGTGSRTSSPYTNYIYVSSGVIQDGEYAVAQPTDVGGDWMNYAGAITEDHTEGDVNGRFFSVNGDYAPGEFYRRSLSGLTAGSHYLFSGWAISTKPGTEIDPDIRFEIRDSAGVLLAEHESGGITEENVWTQNQMFFKSLDGADIELILINNAPGGLGNDLAIDDIEFKIAYNDRDGDGTPDYLDTDSDNDLIPDSVEGNVNSDTDQIPDYLDLDSDGDGIADTLEAGTDPTSPLNSNGTGAYDYQSLDSDGDGITDRLEAGADPTMPLNSDGAGAYDFQSLDSDGDGIPDTLEAGDVPSAPQDTDSDSIPDYRDLDSDNDGALDAQETTADFDDDGVSNYLDLDSDNDGLIDLVETGASPDLDTDGDGRVNGNVGDNGLVDALETTPDSGNTDYTGDGLPDTVLDTDEDSAVDMLDRDSDDDGISDLIEAGGTDIDNNARVDDFTDANGDGRDDFTASSGLPDTDLDEDGIVNRLDPDSDGDGLTDLIEAGLEDNQLRDTDDDNEPDYLDRDSDNDGISDLIEGNDDADGDGLPDYRDSDSNGDGVSDTGDDTNTNTNTGDSENTMNIDSDNDGISDFIEGDRDSDDDGVINRLDLDSDNDGIPDRIEAGASPNAPVDTDNDGIIDVLDRDSDNDGITDTMETVGDEADSNRDGILDGFADTNGDGQDDGLAAIPATILDTDADDIPDYLDTDTDGDAVLDIIEAGIVDENSDGIVDTMSDLDSDGIPDSVDHDQSGGLDVDNDGIEDSADSDFVNEPDSDADGIIDSRDPDANGDGIADLLQDFFSNEPATLPDTDANGVPDYRQVVAPDSLTSSGKIRTGLQGGGCSIAPSGASKDPVLPMLVLMSSVLMIVRRKKAMKLPCMTGREQTCSTTPRLKTLQYDINKRPLQWLVMMTLTVIVTIGSADLLANESGSDGKATLQSTDAQPSADSSSEQQLDRLQRKFYAGIGLGRSWLEPDTSDVEDVDPKDRVQLGVQLTAGMDINKWVSAEIHAADLGTVELSPSGDISYRQIGVSGVFYIGQARHRYNRHGLTAFGRLGFGYLANEGSEGLNFETANPTHLLFGAGLEYSRIGGLALRAETIFFDADVNYSQVSVLYRFGRNKERQVVPLVVEKSSPMPIIPVTPKAQPVLDDDKDGILNTNDDCPNTAPGVVVDPTGCAIFDGVIEGVNFLSGSAILTETSMSILDGVVDKLKAYPTAKIMLSAHTDSQGDADANKQLSAQRARSVAVYLVKSGISAKRLTARAFGETQPIDNNETAAGRLNNRRVELQMLTNQ